MKRNSMLTKIIAVLLCALMVAAWLPKTSAAANDFESGMDRDYGTHADNAIDLVIGTNTDSGLTDTYYTYTPAEDGTLTLTAEDGTTFTVDGVAYAEAVAVTAGTEYIIVATNAALTHSFDAAVVFGCAHANTTTTTVDATCTEAGSTTVTCDDCGEIISTEEIPALEHDYTGENGACVNCGEYQVDSHLYIDFENFSLGSAIGTAFRVERTVRPTGYSTSTSYVYYDKVWLSVKHNRPTDVSNGETTSVTILDESMSTKYYIFMYNFFAKEFNDKLEITVYGEKDGIIYCSPEVFEWTAKDKMVSLFNTNYANYSTDDQAKKTCDVLATMLNYGAKSQIRYGYDVNNLVTNDLDESILNLIPTEDPVFSQENTVGTSGDNYLRSVGVLTASSVELTLQFQLDSDDLSLYQIKYSYVENGTSYEVDATTDDNFYGFTSKLRLTVAFNTLVARQMRIPVTVQLYKDGVAVGDAYTVSIEAALKTFVDNAGTDTTTTAYKNAELAKAIMKFGDAAEAYFA